MLKHIYQETPLIKKNLLEIDALCIVFDTLPFLPQVESHLRRQSLLKSSVYSAKIEGNPLHLNAISPTGQNPSVHQLEIQNLHKTYQYLAVHSTEISLTNLKMLHSKVMHHLSPQAGHFRQEPWAVFNQAGVAIHLAPPPEKVPQLVDDLVNTTQTLNEHPVVIACIAHFLFEKIHPFPDGNGRVGRLFISQILQQHRYSFRTLVPFEEQIEARRAQYYAALEPEKDTTPLVELISTALIQSAKQILAQLKEISIESPADLLLPRRRELLEIIREHPLCTFDFLSRRFSSINPKTLHNDLNQLQKKQFIRKCGSTRGAVYEAQ